jgi:colanic acid/amylovoran biosynthesis glycosyltransferase
MKAGFLPKPLVASVCGTFLKPEMQSVYRQISGLRRHRTLVLTERRLHPDQFPFEPVIVMEKPPPAVRAKRRKQRQRGNFIRRFYYKHLLKTWPPPEKPRPAAPPPPPVYDDAYNLVDLLRQHGPRLAHVYYGHKAVKYLPMLRRWGGPWVVSFHGMDVMADAYRTGDPATLADVFSDARLILARSQSLLERLAELGCPPEKLRLNRTSIPLEHQPAPAIRAAPADGRWIFLQACRLIPKKGLVTTLAAMQEVVRVQPRSRLILAGSGPLLEDLRALAAGMGLSPAQVEFAGWCSQERLADLYAQAHLFLHPSELTAAGDREGIPNALLEAMGSGLPAVATRHGGIPEAVSEGVDGFLVPEKSPGLLAAAILRLTREHGTLSRMSGAAAANIARNFGAERQIRALEDCYEEACAPRP